MSSREENAQWKYAAVSYSKPEHMGEQLNAWAEDGWEPYKIMLTAVNRDQTQQIIVIYRSPRE